MSGYYVRAVQSGDKLTGYDVIRMGTPEVTAYSFTVERYGRRMVAFDKAITTRDRLNAGNKVATNE